MTTGDGATERPYARGRDRREVILAAAARQFANTGFGGTTMSSIANAAGMTDAGLMHHFRSKTDLYLAVLDARNEASTDLLGEEDDLDDAIEAVIGFVKGLAASPEIVRFRAVVSGEALLDGNPAAERIATVHRAALALLIRKVERAQREGTVAVELDAEQIVLEIFALNEGMRHLAVSYPGTFDYAAVFARALRRWRDGLRPHASPQSPGTQRA